jgi:hypothetical protein
MIPDNLPLLACMFPVPVAVHILATSTARPLLLFLHSDLTRGMQVTEKKSRGMLAGVATILVNSVPELIPVWSLKRNVSVPGHTSVPFRIVIKIN